MKLNLLFILIIINLLISIIWIKESNTPFGGYNSKISIKNSYIGNISVINKLPGISDFDFNSKLSYENVTIENIE